MTFAIITPGLFVGAFAERMKFSAIMWFSGLWCLLVYMPIAHMVWGEAGFFSAMGVFDFAGGIVVHITAGTAALVAAILVGKRQGYPERPMPLHNMTMNLIGTVMLWVGWFGLNGGSAMAVVVTKISPSVLGFATGAMAIAFVASVVAYWAATWLKQAIGYDDALDVGAQFGTRAFPAATAIYPRSSPLSCSKLPTSS